MMHMLLPYRPHAPVRTNTLECVRTSSASASSCCAETAGAEGAYAEPYDVLCDVLGAEELALLLAARGRLWLQVAVALPDAKRRIQPPITKCLKATCKGYMQEDCRIGIHDLYKNNNLNSALSEGGLNFHW